MCSTDPKPSPDGAKHEGSPRDGLRAADRSAACALIAGNRAETEGEGRVGDEREGQSVDPLRRNSPRKLSRWDGRVLFQFAVSTVEIRATAGSVMLRHCPASVLTYGSDLAIVAHSSGNLNRLNTPDSV